MSGLGQVGHLCRAAAAAAVRVPRNPLCVNGSPALGKSDPANSSQGAQIGKVVHMGVIPEGFPESSTGASVWEVDRVRRTSRIPKIPVQLKGNPGQKWVSHRGILTKNCEKCKSAMK